MQGKKKPSIDGLFTEVLSGLFPKFMQVQTRNKNSKMYKAPQFISMTPSEGLHFKFEVEFFSLLWTQLSAYIQFYLNMEH